MALNLESVDNGRLAGSMDKKWWTLLAVLTGTFMLLLDVTIVMVAQPAIQSGLHAGFADVQWVLDAYALTLAALLLTSGVLADRYGRRLLFGIGLAIFTVGSLLCGVAQDPLMLIVSRSGQGVGGAIMFAVSLALLGHSFRGRDRGVAFGAWGAIAGIATALGPVLGGVITTEWSWRGIFLVNVPVGVAALAVTVWRVEESRSPRATRLDWPGFVLFTGGLVSLVYGLIRAGEYSWSDGGVIACLAIGVAALAAFIVVEYRVADPMFDVALLRKPAFTGASIAAFAMNGSLYALLLYLVLYLQDVLGYSALQAGLRLAIISGGQFVSASVAGRLSHRVPARWLIGPGLLLVGIGIFFMTGLNGTSSWTHLLAGFIVSGLGAGLVNPPLASAAISVVPPQRAGMASGINSTFRQIGIATGIAALGSMFAAAMQRNLAAHLPAGVAVQIATAIRQGSGGAVIGRHAAAVRSAFAAGLNEEMIVTGILAVAGAVCAVLLIRAQRKPAEAPGAEAPAGAPGAEAPAGAPGGERPGGERPGSQVPVAQRSDRTADPGGEDQYATRAADR
jgi:EmrB/QacA subfamily drug resistance transporter